MESFNAGMKVRGRAIVFLMLAAILWSTGGLLIKLVSWNPLAIAGMRSAIAACLLMIFIRKPKINWSIPQIGGAIAYSVTVILFVTANKMTSAANAILLQYSAPIYVAILGAWVLKEKTKLTDWITILFVISGMVLFFMDELTPEGMLGNIIAILSGVSFAGLVIFMRIQKDGSSIESLLLGNILTALVGTPFMFESMPDKSSWLGLLLLGIFQLGFSYILYAYAVKHVTALEAILIPVIEPILNPIWVLVFIGEKPGSWTILGGIIVILAVTLRCVLPVLNKKSAGESSLSDQKYIANEQLKYVKSEIFKGKI